MHHPLATMPDIHKTLKSQSEIFGFTFLRVTNVTFLLLSLIVAVLAKIETLGMKSPIKSTAATT